MRRETKWVHAHTVSYRYTDDPGVKHIGIVIVSNDTESMASEQGQLMLAEMCGYPDTEILCFLESLSEAPECDIEIVDVLYSDRTVAF